MANAMLTLISFSLLQFHLHLDHNATRSCPCAFHTGHAPKNRSENHPPPINCMHTPNRRRKIFGLMCARLSSNAESNAANDNNDDNNSRALVPLAAWGSRQQAAGRGRVLLLQ